jgi:hypothetical protein
MSQPPERSFLPLMSVRFKSDPNGSRTRVPAVKGRCPGPLDDGVGVLTTSRHMIQYFLRLSSYCRLKQTGRPQLWGVSKNSPNVIPNSPPEADDVAICTYLCPITTP